MLTFGSLFSGVGGFDLGFERAGLKCAWQVENNEFANRILAKRWPDVPRFGDVRTFPPEGDYRVPIVVGGFPCKQTSNAAAVHGRRAGLDGPDSGLWHRMLEIVRLLQPEWVIVENVGGASTYAAEIKSGLEALGFIVPIKPLCLSAEGFGLPHRRRRLFWIADRHGKGLEITRQGGPCKADRKPGRAAHRNTWLPSIAGVVRVADGAASWMDFIGGLENGVKKCSSQADTKADPTCGAVLRAMWEQRELATTSPNVFRGRLRDIVPNVPCPGGLARWMATAEANEELRDLWNTVSAEPLEKTQDVQRKLLKRIRKAERREALASAKVRRERINAIGNACCPVKAEWIGRKILAARNLGDSTCNATS